MADIDKAIDPEEQEELQVRNRTKGMDIEVDVTEEDPELESFEELEDGTIAFGNMPEPVDDTEFSANLADLMDDSDLNSLKNDLMGNIDADKERYRKGKQAYKSDVPEIQKALDEAHGGSTLKVIKPVKKKNGGLATKGQGRAFLKGNR